MLSKSSVKLEQIYFFLFLGYTYFRIFTLLGVKTNFQPLAVHLKSWHYNSLAYTQIAHFQGSLSFKLSRKI